MDYQVFLTYIVLALIVAIIIHIIFKVLYSYHYKKSNDSFSNSQQYITIDSNNLVNNSDTKLSTNGVEINRYNTSKSSCNESVNSQSSDNQIPNNLMSNDFDSVYDYVDDDYINGISNKTPNLIGSTTCDVNNTYTKEFLMDNDILCATEIKPRSKKDLQDYRDNFFGFRSHVWQNSAGVDPVDRLNEKILSGDGDLSQNGKKISDIYDSLTGDRIHKKHCIMTPNLDNITMSSQYKMPGSLGDYYTKDNWIYNYDHVMNGALFYDNVSGVDPLMDDQMAFD